jgi:hypothetical protein
MIDIGTDAEVQLLVFARTWCTLVAQGDWTSAIGIIDEPNHYGVVWTRERVLAALNETFCEGTLFAREFGRPTFSVPAAAKGRERHTFGRAQDGSYWLDYDVPLNGHFSDLTAQFEFHPRPGRFAAMLHDLRVM